MFRLLLLFLMGFVLNAFLYAQSVTYPIVDTDVAEFFSDNEVIPAPSPGEPFYGQDATYMGNNPSYTDRGDGTIIDEVSGLTWEKNMGLKITYTEAFIKADTLTLGAYDDWRVPTIKELYSLILFTGRVSGASAIDLFIDTTYFDQPLGDPDLGEREIDAQTWSSTQYAGLTMNGDSTVFGVNFVDGRIKGYPKYNPGSNNSVPRTMYFRMVRGNPDYGKNDFEDHSNGTISDHATALMWQQSDDGQMRDWESALSYAENLELGGYDNWRLPNAKELQSILDYTRSPQCTGSPAIHSSFECTEILDPDGNPGQYPYFWTSTTHQDGPNPYNSAVYIAFGEAQGVMNDRLMDVHGAGSQRSDPKSGELSDYPQFFGPQGDVRYVFNAVRCVRDISQTGVSPATNTPGNPLFVYPNPTKDLCMIQTPGDILPYEWKLFDSSGRILQSSSQPFVNNIPIDLSNHAQGVYYICLVSEMESTTLKIIKE